MAQSYKKDFNQTNNLAKLDKNQRNNLWNSDFYHTNPTYS